MVITALFDLFRNLRFRSQRMLFCRIRQQHAKRREGGQCRVLERGQAGLRERQRVGRQYARSLTFALRHRLAVLVLFFAVLGGTVQMFRVVPRGFIPDQDDDSINIGLRAAQGTSYDEMFDNVRRVGNLVRTNPNLQRAVAFLGNGPGGPGAMNTARVIMMTTMAALLGALPIALGLGAGGEARRPLGLAVVEDCSSRS